MSHHKFPVGTPVWYRDYEDSFIVVDDRDFMVFPFGEKISLYSIQQGNIIYKHVMETSLFGARFQRNELKRILKVVS